MSTLYAAVAARRRIWYDSRPECRRSLSRPVVSVGNLRVGGSGKTPIVAHVARILLEEGYRPSILSRGYGRRSRIDGVTVVSDGDHVLADLSQAGDEPLMLARMLPGVPVVVAANRHAAGLLAERRLGATVHLLDDGFQHLQLARTVDLVLLDESDLADRPLPSGTLRESIGSVAAADAILFTSDDPSAAERMGRALGIQTFRVVRSLGTPHKVSSVPVSVPPGSRLFAVTGIGRPERFHQDLSATGWQVTGSLAFRDHHRFSRGDVARIEAAAAAAGADVIVTTEKDAVRLEGYGTERVPVIVVPLAARVEPADAFRSWLIARL